jgi:hypothetical protein
MKRLLALALAAALLCGGCAPMLNRSYGPIVRQEPHVQAEDDASALRAENYQGVISALLYFVEQRQEKGTLRLYNYKDDVETDLQAARREVVEEDPLGAYAVDYINFETVSVVSYYEVSFSISYSRTAQQMAAIASTVGTVAIRKSITEAMDSYSNELVLRMGVYDRNPERLEELIREVYASKPGAAMGYPTVTIHFFPNTSGSPRPIAEFLFAYPFNRLEMTRMKRELAQVCGEIDLAALLAAESPEQTARAFLSGRVTLLEESTSPSSATAYGALVEGEADRAGMELAWLLLCQMLEIEGGAYFADEAAPEV